MTQTYNFNDYRILSGYLNQAVVLMGFNEFKEVIENRFFPAIPTIRNDCIDRLVVGEEGGMAYRLFKEHDANKIRDRDKKDWNLNQGLRESIKHYIENAEEYAKKSGFGPIHIQEGYGFNFRRGNFIRPPRADDTYLKIGLQPRNFADEGFGIGSTHIDDIEQLEKFLQMVKEGHSHIKQQLTALLSYQ